MAFEIRQERVFLFSRLSVSFQRAEGVRRPRSRPRHNLGALPVHRVEDYGDRSPQAWDKKNGVFLPLLPEEAIWLGFAARPEQPCVVQMELAGVNVVSGMPFTPALVERPQNYLACPPQLYWDGVYREGTVHPFTAEELVLGPGAFKALRIIVYEPLPGSRFPSSKLGGTDPEPLHALFPGVEPPQSSIVLPDPHGVRMWDLHSSTAIYVYFLEPERYQELTGQPAPSPRQDKDTYSGYHLP
jgi:hypothetical protein